MATAIAAPQIGDSDPIAARKFEQLLATARANRPGDDIGLIERAYRFCLLHHEGQKRASGEPFIIHPLEVALALAEMKLDSTAIAAGLLHDAVEDTPVTTEEISAQFGEQVAHIVEGVTKIDKIQFANAEDRQAENVRKMLLAMVSDVRVVLIKLADRLHNMRTLQHLPPEKQVSIARETMDIYAPLAHRLGMGKVRGELEDLGFRYVDPIAFEQVRAAVEAKRGEGEAFLERVEKLLEEQMRENAIEGRVEWRIKRLYSVHGKLLAQKISVEQVYDLLALRVVTKTVKDCYGMMGLIHGLWRPVPGRIKDFIAMPRPNMYQSLHTTVMAEGGHQFEVQIRTEEMHRTAEEGIAAHWKYKGGNEVTTRDEQRLAWVRQVVEWQREMSDPSEFLSSLKIDLYPEEVYTFTPKGKVVVLPQDASPIDFAYAIHTEVGNTCIGAKVNGRMAPLRTKLRNGDVVEVTTQAGRSPSRDWLQFAKSSKARNKIKHWINERQRERSVEIGKKLLEREARKFKAAISKLTDEDYLRAANDSGLAAVDDMMAGIGFGKYSARQVLNKLMPGVTHQQEPQDPDASQGLGEVVKKIIFGKDYDTLKVEGGADMLVYRARCCNPIRGEEIIGYVTRGKGVAVHARKCPNVENLLFESDRRIAVEWARATATPAGKPSTYPVKLTVYCDDSPGMLKELTAVISDDGTNIRGVDIKSGLGDGTEAEVGFLIEAEDVKHLNRLVAHLRKLQGVRDVQRMQRI
jgi:guanosine-3',5'-bis(diphosphate) 3'-pyrophosphohydrolase